MRLASRIVFVCLMLVLCAAPCARPVNAAPSNTVAIPLVVNQSQQWPFPNEAYGVLPVESAPTDLPAEEHPDLNLALRGYESTSAYAGLVQYNGDTDGGAPDLRGLLVGSLVPAFARVYRVYDWNWATNSRGGLISYPAVTALGLAVTPGQSILVPWSDYSINEGLGYQALVLYASESRITLKYTNEDNVVHGYTLHIENVAVHPDLLQTYRASNEGGRGTLPALRAGQCVGVASSDVLTIAIRDNGTFMDPRSQKDWWE